MHRGASSFRDQSIRKQNRANFREEGFKPEGNEATEGLEGILNAFKDNKRVGVSGPSGTLSWSSTPSHWAQGRTRLTAHGSDGSSSLPRG